MGGAAMGGHPLGAGGAVFAAQNTTMVAQGATTHAMAGAGAGLGQQQAGQSMPQRQ